MHPNFQDLPPTLSIAEAGKLLRVSRATAYEYARQGDIETVRFNNRYVVPTAALLRKLGIETAARSPLGREVGGGSAGA